MKTSQLVQEWQNEAVLKTRREDLLRLLEKRGKGSVPSDLAEMIQAIEDMNLLLLWFDAAVEASSIDDFRTKVQR